MILSVDYLYWLAGILLVSTALIILRDKEHPRRFMSAMFWADLGVLFMVGDKIPAAAVGIQILALSAIAAGGGLRRSVPRRLSASVREANSRRLNWKASYPRTGNAVLHVGWHSRAGESESWLNIFNRPIKY